MLQNTLRTANKYFHFWEGKWYGQDWNKPLPIRALLKHTLLSFYLSTMTLIFLFWPQATIEVGNFFTFKRFNTWINVNGFGFHGYYNQFIMCNFNLMAYNFIKDSIHISNTFILISLYVVFDIHLMYEVKMNMELFCTSYFLNILRLNPQLHR